MQHHSYIVAILMLQTIQLTFYISRWMIQIKAAIQQQNQYIALHYCIKCILWHYDTKHQIIGYTRLLKSNLVTDSSEMKSCDHWLILCSKRNEILISDSENPQISFKYINDVSDTRSYPTIDTSYNIQRFCHKV